MKIRRTLAAALLALGCQHHTPPAVAHEEPPAPLLPVAADVPVTDASPATRIDASADPALVARLSRLADDIVGTVSRTRGLAVTHPVARGVMSRQQIVARLRERMRREYPPGEVELEGAMLKSLGLIPEGMDYEQSMFDLLEEQVLGFYDPDEARLYIADWVPVSGQAETMAHELTHALQDQHFHIAEYVHHERGHGDAQVAAMALLEGDATASMLDYALSRRHMRVRELPDPDAMMRGQIDAAQQPRLAAAPRAIRETLLFPYLTGFSMCARLLREGSDYSAIDALLRSPPQSSEQVLHAEKLSAREAPIAVAAVVPPAMSEWAIAYDDVMGELNARLFFQGAVTDPQAESAAAGWGGDHAVLLVPRAEVRTDGGAQVSRTGLAHSTLLWNVVMDPGPRGHDDAQAVEFSTRAATVLAHRHETSAVATVAGAMAARTIDATHVSLVARAGRRVLVAERVPTERAARVVAWFSSLPSP